jgi:hypothetical protein
VIDFFECCEDIPLADFVVLGVAGFPILPRQARDSDNKIYF